MDTTSLLKTARANRSGEKIPRQRPLNSLEALQQKGLVGADTSGQLAAVSQRFAVAVTPAMAELIDPQNPNDPIARQFVPAPEELEDHPNDVSDPIGDRRHSPVAGIVHRYPDRVLLTPIHVCPVYCRFCFRRETVGKVNQALLTEAEQQTALNYIREHTEIWEVILSGGDPLLLSPRRLQTIISELDAMEHVAVIRIHSRVPAVDPDRISQHLIKSLRTNKALYVVLHTNHARELTAAARKACARLVDSGIPMLSQTVLLKDVNDDPVTLEQLFRQLVAIRIKPYYLHHADRAPGTAHFRTSIEHGQSVVRALRGRVSGICQPSYVLDIPGGAGKVPLEPSWAVTADGQNYQIRDYQGRSHEYEDNYGDTELPST